MKSRRAKWFLGVFFISCCLGDGVPAMAMSGGGEASDSNAFTVASSLGSGFLAAGGTNVDANYRLLLGITAREPNLKASDYSTAVSVVHGEILGALRGEIVPPPEFVAQHMRLYSADEQFPANVAALSYYHGSNEYMAVVTGIDIHRVYLFMRGGGVIPDGSYEDTNAILKMVTSIFKLTAEERSDPPVITLERKGSIGVLQVKRVGEWNSNVLNLLRGVCCGNEAVLSVTTDDRDQRATRPAADDWFDGVERSVKKNKEAEAKAKRAFSPEALEILQRLHLMDMGDLPSTESERKKLKEEYLRIVNGPMEQLPEERKKFR